MRTSTLQRHLGKQFTVTRNRGQVEALTSDGRRPVHFRLDKSWRKASEAAAYIKSRMPVATLRPQ